MKKAAIYARVSTPDQHLENQVIQLKTLASQRQIEIVRQYSDRGVSGSKARRPGLDAMMADARKEEFSVVLVAAFDRIARSTKNFLEIVDELNDLNVEFVSARESVDSSTAQGKMFITMISGFAELEKSILIERIKSGMRRARMDGRRLGRAPLDIDRDALVRDRLSGMSLTQVASLIGQYRAFYPEPEPPLPVGSYYAYQANPKSEDWSVCQIVRRGRGFGEEIFGTYPTKEEAVQHLKKLVGRKSK